MIFFIMPTKIRLFNLYLDYNNMYFRLRFGLANSINTYLKLKIRVVRGEGGISVTLNAYQLNSQYLNLSLIYICISELYKSSI